MTGTKFLNLPSAKSVTAETRHARRVLINGRTVKVFDIPGLLEADQANIDRNVAEIDKAHEECDESYRVFVFRVGNGGRLDNDDLIA
jgi:hypothetical protein